MAVANSGRSGKGEVQGNVSALSYFITNALNEIYAFYTVKDDLLKKFRDQWGWPPPLNLLLMVNNVSCN